MSYQALVIVESPTKAKTIGKILGSSFLVRACGGHVKDLPEYRLGVNIGEDFKPTYVTLKGKRKILKDLKDAVKRVSTVYLAPDPDREGEAISWHLLNELQDNRSHFFRLVLYEITKSAVFCALSSPGSIDMNKVNAQQARRILDRLVGYKLSPLLWKKVRGGLSAGRVQSVALKIICDREREIENFTPQEYWTISAVFSRNGQRFEAELTKVNGKKPIIKTQKEAAKVIQDASSVKYRIMRCRRSKRRRSPAPPFITSTLQQEASLKLQFSANKTMMIAQQLYEGVEIGNEEIVGLITYMRTDSVRISSAFQEAARQYIKEKFGAEYLPSSPPVYKTKARVQGAHEGIRPTSMSRPPEAIKEFLSHDQFQLYDLIWKRFVASQMKEATYQVYTIDIEGGKYLFRALSSKVIFPGFTILYVEEGEDADEVKPVEQSLPDVNPGDEVSSEDLTQVQHFTKPPPRYSEATLVKTLEREGIGRPSTYATIITTILQRGYVKRSGGRLHPTDLGFTVTDLLTKSFPDILDIHFTSQVEAKLDAVEEGRMRWKEVLEGFWSPFSDALIRARDEMKNVKVEHEVFTGEVCPKCGGRIKIKFGRYGRFLACSSFPECKYTRPYTTGIPCPGEGCGGVLIEKRTQRGKSFYGCDRYPHCRFATWDEPITALCPDCSANLGKRIRRGKTSFVCLRPGCGYSMEAKDEEKGKDAVFDVG